MLDRLNSKVIRLVITGGGTGGHVYPALSVLEALNGDPRPDSGDGHEGPPSVDSLYVGSADGLEERIVSRAGLKFRAVAAGAIRGKSPQRVARALGRLWRGYRQSKRIIAEYRPAAVLATGGYVCVPVVLAARRSGVPVLVYLPDAEAGWAVWLTSRLAKKIAVTIPEAAHNLPGGKVVVTGYPVRASLGRSSRSKGRAAFGLDENRPTLLVLGGSRGAKSINDAVLSALPELLPVAQVIHVCGANDLARVAEQVSDLSPERRRRYVLRAYLDEEQGAAMAAADLCVSRSGASVLGEMPYFGLPSILVPYPYAGAHQERNAAYLVEAGAAVRLADRELSRLPALLQDLLRDPNRLETMAEKSKQLSRPDAASKIGDLLLTLAA